MKGYIENRLREYVTKEIVNHDHRQILYYLICEHSCRVSSQTEMKEDITNLIRELDKFKEQLGD